jgi:plastocyanin
MTGRAGTQRRAGLVAIIFSVILVGFVAGCSSDSGNPYGSSGGGGNPGANEIWIRGMAFDPGTRTLSVGTTLTWTNKDAATHTVTGSGWGSGNLAQNATYAHTFDTPGSYPYHCAIHSGMTGTITVQ